MVSLKSVFALKLHTLCGHHRDCSKVLTRHIPPLLKILQWFSHGWQTLAWHRKFSTSCLPISPVSLYYFLPCLLCLGKIKLLAVMCHVISHQYSFTHGGPLTWTLLSLLPCLLYWIASSQSSGLTQVSFPPRRLNSIPSMGEDPHFLVPIATSIMILVTLYKVPFFAYLCDLLL